MRSHATETKLFLILNGHNISKKKKKNHQTAEHLWEDFFNEDIDANFDLRPERALWKAAICAGIMDCIMAHKKEKEYTERMVRTFKLPRDYRMRKEYLYEWLTTKQASKHNPRPLIWMLDLLFDNEDEIHDKIVQKIKTVISA